MPEQESPAPSERPKREVDPKYERMRLKNLRADHDLSLRWETSRLTKLREVAEQSGVEKALEELSEVLMKAYLNDAIWEELIKPPFSEQQVRAACAVAAERMGEAIANAGSSPTNSWEVRVGALRDLIHYADLAHDPARDKIVENLAQAKAAAYGGEFSAEGRAAQIDAVCASLGTAAPAEKVAALLSERMKIALDAMLKGGSYRAESEVRRLAPVIGDVTDDMKAKALLVFPKFDHFFADEIVAFVRKFSIPPEIVEPKVRQYMADGIQEAIKEKSATYLNQRKAILDALGLSMDEYAEELLKLADVLLDKGSLYETAELFKEFNLDLSALDQEPRRSKFKKLLEGVLENIPEMGREEREGWFVPRFTEKPADAPPADNPFAPRKLGPADKKWGPFWRWYDLGYIPVVNGLLDRQVGDMLQKAKAETGRRMYVVEEFRRTITLPLDYRPSAANLAEAKALLLRQLGEHSEGFTDTAEELGVDLRDPEVQQAAFALVIHEIGIWEYQSPVEKAQAIVERYSLPAGTMERPEVRAALRDQMYSRLAHGNEADAVSLRDEARLQTEFAAPEATLAARKGVSALLEKGECRVAKNFSTSMSIADEMVSPAARQAAVAGFGHLLSKNQALAACEFSEEAGIATASIVEKVDEQPGPVIRALDALPFKFLQKIDPKTHVLKYQKDLGIPSPAMYAEYRALVDKKDTVGLTAYVTRTKELVGSLTSSARQPSDIAKQPHYRELMEIVYPNNIGTQWTDFENNESCEDRTDDLAAYKIRDHYAFTVAPGSDMVLKTGREKNEQGLRDLESPLQKANTLFAGTDFQKTAMLAVFDKELAAACSELKPPEAFATREEKLFGLILEHAAGSFPASRFKELLIAYQYAEFEDIREYLEGTRARSEHSRNPEYAYMLELREFFSDRLKEVSRRVSELALKNPDLQKALPGYFKRIAEKEANRMSGDAVNKLQIEKLGLSERFLTQVARELKKADGRERTPEETAALIRDYEERTLAVAEPPPSAGETNPAVEGMIRSQRLKTIQAIEALSGTPVQPSDVRLGDVDLRSILEQRRSLQSGEYDEKTFASYVGRRFGDVFEPELTVLDAELAKYEPKDGENKDAKPKRVEAFITKNHSSAHARATAGVCVAGDNPSKAERNGLDTCMWRMPNYFQMVLRDADTKLCKGCVLLHLEEDNGKKILTASMNPSSTYLYQVNEAEMFRNLREQLIVFAKDNDIDAIAVSKNQQIRTNRTGGLFERAMDASIAERKKEHLFKDFRIFSYQPRYKQETVDIIWSKDQAA